MRDPDTLVERLRDEADLCRAETATDVAELLDEAADHIEHLITQTLDLLHAAGTVEQAMADDLVKIAERCDNLEAENARLTAEIDDLKGIAAANGIDLEEHAALAGEE